MISLESHHKPENFSDSIALAFTKSILIAVPVSYLFFLPFFFGNSFNMNFWLIYGTGIFLLILGYFMHKYVVNFF